MCTTFLLVRVDAAVDFEHEFDDQMEEHERNHHPGCPPRHERLVQVESDEESRHCKRDVTQFQMLSVRKNLSSSEDVYLKGLKQWFR